MSKIDYKPRPCKWCGEMIVKPVNAAQRFHKECRELKEEHEREVLESRREQRKREKFVNIAEVKPENAELIDRRFMLVDKICSKCERTFMFNVRPQRLVCDCCKHEAHAKREKKYKQQRRETAEVQKREQPKEWRPTRCIGCIYYRGVSSSCIGTSQKACHYALDTGTIRGYDPEFCYMKPNTAYTKSTNV